VLARRPAALGVAVAAALPLAGSAALDLLEAIDAQGDDVIVIVGATGGVGSMAIQLAARQGLTVVATARPAQDTFVRDLGAAATIDYTAGDVAAAVRARYPSGVAALIDVVDQQDALSELASIVRPGGHVASLLGAADLEGLTASGIVGHNVSAVPTVEKLRTLADMAASGTLRVPIQATYPLDLALDALQAFQQGTLGKLVVIPS
jgi:NADPH:quinone reductase-like Zn-dependent oxidoreductase